MFVMFRISFGILFQSLGAMLEKTLSPYVFVRDLGSFNSLFETERNDLDYCLYVVFFSNTQVLQC